MHSNGYLCSIQNENAADDLIYKYNTTNPPPIPTEEHSVINIAAVENSSALALCVRPIDTIARANNNIIPSLIEHSKSIHTVKQESRQKYHASTTISAPDRKNHIIKHNEMHDRYINSLAKEVNSNRTLSDRNTEPSTKMWLSRSYIKYHRTHNTTSRAPQPQNNSVTGELFTTKIETRCKSTEEDNNVIRDKE